MPQTLKRPCSIGAIREEARPDNAGCGLGVVSAGVLEGAKSKQRKFVETVELQIGLKNYDPQKDKRFSGSVKLPYCPRPGLKVRRRWRVGRQGGGEALSTQQSQMGHRAASKGLQGMKGAEPAYCRWLLPHRAPNPCSHSPPLLPGLRAG